MMMMVITNYTNASTEENNEKKKSVYKHTNKDTAGRKLGRMLDVDVDIYILKYKLKAILCHNRWESLRIVLNFQGKYQFSQFQDDLFM